MYVSNVMQKLFRLMAILAMGLAAFSCSFKADRDEPYVQFADRFAHALAEGRFEDANSMLTDDQRPMLTAAELQKAYKQMLEYTGKKFDSHDTITTIEPITSMTDWPDKRIGDVGWVYVAMSGDGFSEAVTVVVARSRNDLGIRSIEWGRP